MTRGKKVCKILKEIRQQIADKNDIEYITSECHFHGECKGTCPKCEAEVRYLENELHKRSQLGKAASIAGISLGIASTFAACNTPKYSTHNQNNVSTTEEVLSAEMLPPIIEQDMTGGGAVITAEEILLMEQRFNVSPKYPGGNKACLKFIKENLVYPKEAIESRVEGTVYVNFTIEKDGSISNIGAIGLGSGCNEEAVRVVSMMPNWKPGKYRGEKVETYHSMPIHFNLDDK